LVTACKPEAIKVNKRQLNGFWELTQAKRNGNPTDLLKGGYFYFGSTGKMATNIKGDTLNELYSLEGDLIKTLGPENLTFKVNYISKDTLKLTSKIGKSNFDFMGVRFKEK
jgi:hypothetical protein